MKKLLLIGTALALFSCEVAPAFATTSTVNPNVPAQGSALSSSTLRANFLAAYNDITNLWASIASLSASLAPSATIDTTNASNISTGTLNSSLLPALPAGKMPAFTGDISTSAGSTSTTLATVNSNTGSFGSANAVPVLTLDGKGRVTAASTVSTVGSFNGRTGSVSPASGDYTVSQVTGAAPLASPTFTGTVNGAAVTWSGVSTALNFAATGTSADTLPVGTTGQAPSAANGMVRYDSTLNRVFVAISNAWQSVFTTADVLPVANGGTGSSAGDISALTAKASGSSQTVSRSISSHLGDTLFAKDYGAVCDGTTDDTAAFTAASLAGKNAGGGRIMFSGECAVCGVTLYRLTVLDGGNINQSELIETPSCTTYAVASENYSTNHGTTNAYPSSTAVPYFQGIVNARINGNKGNGATGKGFAFYGNMPIIENFMVYSSGSDGLDIEEGAGSSGIQGGANWYGQPETTINNVFAVGNTGYGYYTNGGNDQRVGDVIVAGNGNCGFYSTGIAGFDSLKSLHSYGNGTTNSSCGIYFDSQVHASQIETDGDTLTLTGRAIGSVIQDWYGFGLSTLTQGGSNVWFGTMNAGLPSGTTNTTVINWNAVGGGANYVYVGGNSSSGNTGLKVSGYNSSFKDVEVAGFVGTSNVCIQITGSQETVIGRTSNCTTHLAYTGYNQSVTDLRMSDASANTAFTGNPVSGDVFKIRTSGSLTQQSFDSTSGTNTGFGSYAPVSQVDIATGNRGVSFGAGQAGLNGLLLTDRYSESANTGMTLAEGGKNATSQYGYLFNLIGVNAYYNSATDAITRYTTNGGFSQTMGITMSSDSGQTGGTRMTFFTGTTPTERMAIFYNGNVAIGTTANVSLLTVNGNYATGASGRAYNTGTTSDTIAAGIASTYESNNSATTTLTFAAPLGDGERRRVCLKNAATVTWAVTSPATAVAGLPTTFAAGQCVEAVYNSTSGTPTNAPATTWLVY